MKKTNTIEAKRLTNGTLVQVLPDGSTRALEDKTDWRRLRAMTDEEVTAAALSDPDAQPAETSRPARRSPRAKTLRRALSLTQEEFADGIIFRLEHCGIGSRGVVNRINRPALI